jgi:2-dehydropantoate 2-reductase
MRIYVMGSGGLGGYFGGALARSGADVMFIARGAHLHALRTNGLTVHSVHGDFTIPVHACSDPAGLPPADVVLFCVKTYAVPDAVALLQSVVHPQTILLTLQNGVDTPAQLQTLLQRGIVLAGATRTGSTLVEPGVIVQQTTDHTIEFGSLDGRHAPEVEQVCSVLEQAGIPTIVAADMHKTLWEKLVFIAAFSGLSTLTQLTPTVLLAHASTRALYRTVMHETAAVAHAAGVMLEADIVERTMNYLDAQDDLGDSSMAVDFQYRRPIEVDAINGAVVRHGQRLDVPTPVNATIYGSLVVMDQVNRAGSAASPSTEETA